ncbi:MAG TPA: transporter substrate-binding domain-containing protein [Acetobacteraceae bacterium]|nr:transporter substrate-binding domain-containing protein [Acetobacteraceae bacterium]
MNRREVFAASATAALLAAAHSGPAAGQSAPGASTLDRILSEKRIRITAEVTSPPFGTLDRNGEPDGAEIATSRQLAKDLGVELDLVQVTAPQRIPALLAGRADIAISSLSITLDRAKTVAFCNPHGALSTVIMGPQKAAIAKPEDMVGKRIGLTRGTLEEAVVPKGAPPGVRFVFFDDIAATIQAVLSGQVDAAGMSAFAARSVAERNPSAGIEDKFRVSTAFYAAAARPADFELRHWVNTWIFLNSRNGVLAAIFEKYTGTKLPELPVI